MTWFKRLIKRGLLSMQFKPASDLTTLELAYILSKSPLIDDWDNIKITQKSWDEMPDDIQRHFVLAPPE